MSIITVDFDGTLYQHSSVPSMLKGGRKIFTSKQGVSIVLDFINGSLKKKEKNGGDFRIVLLKSFFRQMKGKNSEEMDSFFESTLDMSSKSVNYDLVSTIKEHLKNSDRVIIISGALNIVLELLVKKLNIQAHVMGTPLCYDENGLCTGEIGDVNRGVDKVNKLKLWLENNDAGKESIWAYADSKADIPLLEFADKAVVVNPKNAMKKIAESNGWEIFDN